MAAARPSRAWRVFLALVLRDLRVELRSREVLYTASLFAIVLVTLFIFAGFGSLQGRREAAPGVLWVSITFVGSLVHSRTFQREHEDRAIESLMMVPGISGPLYAAKVIVNLLLLGAMELLLLPAISLTFEGGFGRQPMLFGLVVASGTLGFVALGTVVSAALATVRMQEVLLPLVLFPLALPLLVAGVRASASVADGASFAAVQGWIALMLAFDIAFVAIGRWLFGEAIDGDTR